MKKTRPIYTRRDGDVCVWLSFYRLFLQVGRKRMRILRASHRGDTVGMISEALLLMGIKHIWMGDVCVLQLGTLELRMAKREQDALLYTSQLKLMIPPDHAFRMRALLYLQERWREGYRGDERKWAMETVFDRWNAPVLARDMITVVNSGVEPFSLLKWNIFRGGLEHPVISVLWCGFWIVVSQKTARHLKRKEGEYRWSSKKGYRLAGHAENKIFKTLHRYCDDGNE